MALSSLLLFYTNCGSNFESNSILNTTEFASGTPGSESSLIEVMAFNLLTKSNDQVKAYGYVNKFNVSFTEDKTINLPHVVLSGEVCVPSLANEVQVKIKRFFKVDSQIANAEPTEQSYMSESLPISLTKIKGPSFCGEASYKFVYNSSVESLKIQSQYITGAAQLVHSDYFIVDISHASLQEGGLESPLISQIDKSLQAVSNYEVIPPVIDEPLGVWGPWNKVKDGECTADIQKYISTRVCETGKVCLRDDGMRETTEEVVSSEACQSLGVWSDWKQTSVSECADGRRTVKSVRDCSDDRFCKNSDNKLVKSEERSISEVCEVTPDPEPPGTGGVKSLFNKNINNLRVLFVGNSYHAAAIPTKPTGGVSPDSSKSIFREFRRLLEDQLPNVTVRSRSIGGGTLKAHWDGGTRNEVRNGNYDLLIVQGRYHRFDQQESFISEYNTYVDNFINLAKQSNTKVIVYGLWSTDAWFNNGNNFYGELVHKIYGDSARRHKVAYAPNGMAHDLLHRHFTNTSSEQVAENKLTTDNVHANYVLAYMVVNMLYGTIFGEQPPSNMYKRPELSRADADLARRGKQSAVLATTAIN